MEEAPLHGRYDPRTLTLGWLRSPAGLERIGVEPDGELTPTALERLRAGQHPVSGEPLFTPTGKGYSLGLPMSSDWWPSLGTLGRPELAALGLRAADAVIDRWAQKFALVAHEPGGKLAPASGVLGVLGFHDENVCTLGTMMTDAHVHAVLIGLVSEAGGVAPISSVAGPPLSQHGHMLHDVWRQVLEQDTRRVDAVVMDAWLNGELTPDQPGEPG